MVTSISQTNLNTPSQDPYLGHTIDGAILEKKLGQGGMGSVYLARHINLDKYIAIKILPAEFTRDSQYVARFLREARSAAKLEHQNIIQVFNVGEQNSIYFISMQFLQGQSLQTMIEAQKIPLPQALWVMNFAMKGLAFAHQNGIIHRDIKPDNIMISSTGELKLVDFGLARSSESGNTLSSPGQIMGTPYFMSPEQCNGESVDQRTDIYALGITFYYMLAGFLPYDGKTPMSVLMQHANEAPQKSLAPSVDIPSEISAIVFKMMSKNTEERYQNFLQPLSELEPLLQKYQASPLYSAPVEFEEKKLSSIITPDMPTKIIDGAGTGSSYVPAAATEPNIPSNIPLSASPSSLLATPKATEFVGGTVSPNIPASLLNSPQNPYGSQAIYPKPRAREMSPITIFLSLLCLLVIPIVSIFLFKFFTEEEEHEPKKNSTKEREVLATKTNNPKNNPKINHQTQSNKKEDFDFQNEEAWEEKLTELKSMREEVLNGEWVFKARAYVKDQKVRNLTQLYLLFHKHKKHLSDEKIVEFEVCFDDIKSYIEDEFAIGWRINSILFPKVTNK